MRLVYGDLPTLMVWVIQFVTREADRHVGLDAVMRFLNAF